MFDCTERITYKYLTRDEQLSVIKFCRSNSTFNWIFYVFFVFPLYFQKITTTDRGSRSAVIIVHRNAPPSTLIMHSKLL